MDKEIFGFQQELSSGLCWFKTKEQAKQAVKSFEIATGTKFITLSHDVYGSTLFLCFKLGSVLKYTYVTYRCAVTGQSGILFWSEVKC